MKSIPGRVVLFCLALTLISCDCIGQVTFNIRHFLSSATSFNTAYEVDSGYVVVGAGFGAGEQDHLELKLFSFNKSGELIEEKGIGGIPQSLWLFPAFGSDSYVDDYFISQGDGSTVESDSTSAYIAVFSKDLDTLFSVNFASPYFGLPYNGSGFINSYYSMIAPDSSIFVECQIFSEEFDNDCMIKKLDKNGNLLWNYFCPADDGIDASGAMKPYNGGVILVLVNAYFDFQAYTYNYNLNRSKFICLDSLGNELWQLEPPSDLTPSSWVDMLIDGNNLVAAGCISEYPNEVPYHSQATVTKLDMDGNLIWLARAGDYSEHAYRTFENITQTHDSNYVASGIYVDFNVEDPELDGTSNENGWVVKFDRETGETIWERFYHYVQSPFDKHYVRDIKATSDGGVIFSGAAVDGWVNGNPNLQLPVQQGWLVKLDECGCLVPGCDQFCSYTDTSSVKLTDDYFIIGPNPASQFLNIFLGNHENTQVEDLHFQLHDLSGRLIYEFQPTTINTTYMLDIEHWDSGVYILSLTDHQSALQITKWVKS